jgi:hypothetical protein
MTDDRPTTLRRLAAHLAADTRLRDSTASAADFEKALQAGVVAIGEGNHLRIYARRSQPAERRQRDHVIRAMLAQGIKPPAISEAVRCSVRHVYAGKAGVGQPVDGA